MDFNLMINYLSEEMDGAIKYHKMAEECKKENKSECLPLFNMATDEMTHAEWIHDYIVAHAQTIPSDVEERYNKYRAAHNF